MISKLTNSFNLTPIFQYLNNNYPIKQITIKSKDIRLNNLMQKINDITKRKELGNIMAQQLPYDMSVKQNIYKLREQIIKQFSNPTTKKDFYITVNNWIKAATTPLSSPSSFSS